MLDINEILSLLREPLGKFADRSAKWLLANIDNLQGLLEIIGSDLVESLDFSNVQIVNTTFIADNFREQESDMVFLLPFKDTDKTEVMIYILIEHQSTVDPTMGFRLLFYMCQIWDQQRQKWVSENVQKRKWRFRPIIPVVFYTGKQRWQTLPALETLMAVPEALTRFIPKFETLLLDVKGEPDANLLKTDRPFGWLMTVLKQELADTPMFISALERLGVHLGTLSDADQASWKQAIYYLYLLIFYRRSEEEREALEQLVSDHQQTLKLSGEETELMQSMAEYYLEQGIQQGREQGIQQGREQGIQQGREQGIQQGARQMSIESTLNILNKRFPNVDVNALKPNLEAIDDLNLLKQLNLNASIANSFNAFKEDLDA